MTPNADGVACARLIVGGAVFTGNVEHGIDVPTCC
jgi:hypothetical protein